MPFRTSRVGCSQYASCMNLVPDFLTQWSFWQAFAPGAACGAILTQFGTGINGWISDRRASKLEDKKMNRTESREDKKESDERIRKACSAFAGTCEEVLSASLDVKGVFNVFRDALNDRTGKVDPNAMAKAMFAETQVDEMKRVGKAYSDLKLEAPGPIMQSATRVYRALQELMRTTTQPLARPVTFKSAAAELNAFIEVFRDHFGIDRYSEDDAKRETATYLETLQAQTDDFIEEAKRDMREAGFRSTPWDADR